MKTIVMGAPQAIPKCVFFETIFASVHEVNLLLGLKCHLEKHIHTKDSLDTFEC